MATPRVIKTDFPFVVFSIEADRDYLLARHLSFTGAGFHSRAGFLGQQACEKYMKALTVQSQGEYLQTHQLLPLADACAKIDPYFADEKTRNTLRNFDYFEQVGRYGAAANFDPLAVQNDEITTAGVMIWKQEYLQDLDAFVFKTRSSFDYKKVNYSDSLAAVLAHNKKDILAGNWSGKPPLYVILTKDNHYFTRA
jgi:HEPN domain-containing protein